MSRLESLDLSRTSVSGRGVRALSALPNLKRLRLWQCEKVGDEIAAHLPALKKVETLDLAETGVSDEVLDRLGEMPELRQVFLGGTKASAEGVERFRTGHSRIRITWWEKPPEPERFNNVAP